MKLANNANYTAEDLARYIINRCWEINNPVTNLRLNKMLYLMWIWYYRDTKTSLFKDSVFAHSAGPMIDTICDKYKAYTNAYIKDTDNAGLIFNSEEDRLLINEYINKCTSKSIFDLLKACREPGGAWDKTFRNGENPGCIIPFAAIIKESQNI